MKKITIITYHYVRPIKKSKFPNLKGLELKNFKNQLNFIQSKYKILDFDMFVNILKKRKKINGNLCLLTFDDGYKDHIKYVLPELKKRRLKGFFFPPSILYDKKKILNVNKIHFLIEKKINSVKLIKEIFEIVKNKSYINSSYPISSLLKLQKNFKNTDRFDNKEISFIKYLLQIYFDEKRSSYILNILFKKLFNVRESRFFSDLYMSKNDLKKLIKNGMYVGGHGYNHVHLKNLKKEAQLKEINKNLKFLKSLGISTKEWIMCYPYGSYNKNLKNILKKKRCLCAFTTNKGLVDIKKDNFYEFNRLDTNDIKIPLRVI